MKAYFLNCSDNQINYSLCLQKGRAGFTTKTPKEGDEVFLLVKRNDNKLYCGANGILGAETNDKPWPDKHKYKVAFEIKWTIFEAFAINDGMKVIDTYWSGLVRSPNNIIGFDKKGNAFYDWLKSIINQSETVPNNESSNENSNEENYSNLIDDFCQHLESKKLHFSREIVSRYICSLIAKPFVILTGNSGTGKTKIAIEFAEWISSNENQYNIIPVGADWTDNRPVIGYINPLHNPPIYNSTSILDLILKAEKDKTNPYFLILDEMNLSHVERYFSDFLSAMESEKAIPLHKHGNDILDTANIKIEKSITLPSNLFITGTVNVDETTYMFSPKVLDRANVIEIKAQEEGLSNFPNNSAGNSPDGKKYCNYFINESNNSKDQAKFTSIDNFDDLKSTLLDIFCIMEKHDLEFGFRTMKESYQYAFANKELDNKKSLEAQLDEIIIQRILPKLNGSRSKLEKLLIGLIEVCKKDFERKKTLEYIDNSTNIRNYKLDDIKIDTIRFKLSYQKLSKMYTKLKSDQFVSFI